MGREYYGEKGEGKRRKGEGKRRIKKGGKAGGRKLDSTAFIPGYTIYMHIGSENGLEWQQVLYTQIRFPFPPQKREKRGTGNLRRIGTGYMDETKKGGIKIGEGEDGFGFLYIPMPVFVFFFFGIVRTTKLDRDFEASM